MRLIKGVRPAGVFIRGKMDAEKELALEVRKLLQPCLTPSLETIHPDIHNAISDVLDMCREVYWKGVVPPLQEK